MGRYPLDLERSQQTPSMGYHVDEQVFKNRKIINIKKRLTEFSEKLHYTCLERINFLSYIVKVKGWKSYINERKTLPCCCILKR